MIKQIIENNTEVKPNSKKLEALREYFAGCFTAEGAFDIERFKDIMKDEVNISNEGYSLDFLGKDYSNLIASIDTTTVIEPDLEHNSKPENKDSENVYISGDNLDALKHLLKSYAGKVKCIYIDPPYNTGSDGFVYNDSFKFTPEELEKKLSIGEDEAKRILDLTSRGSSTHSAWLMFMLPRLQLARELLSKDGVIFISIDDNEQANLKLLCDYVFGEDNCLGTIANINNPKGRSDDKYIATAHEYILVYAKNEENVIWLGFEPVEDRIIKRYNKTDLNGKKYREIDLRKTGENDLREDRPNLFYYFHYNQKTGDFFPSRESEGKDGYVVIRPLREDGNEGNWRWGMDTANDQISQLIPKFMPARKVWGVMQKDYLEGRSLVKPTSAWTFKDVNSERGTEDFVNLGFDKRIFPKPKPVGTISRCISLISKNDKDIVLDFFSGSATAAQALLRLNVEDGIKRKFIMVQLQENCPEDSEAYKAGYRTIDEIGQERIKRVTAKIKADNPLFAGDLGFKHYTLKDVPENVLDKIIEFDPNASGFANNLLEMFGSETVLETWKVRDGYGMNAKVEEVKLADYTAYQCGDHLYLTDEGMSDEAITALVDKYGEQTDWGPHYVVLFGYSFNFGATDALKKNLPLLNEGEKQIKINIDIRY